MIALFNIPVEGHAFCPTSSHVIPTHSRPLICPATISSKWPRGSVQGLSSLSITTTCHSTVVDKPYSRHSSPSLTESTARARRHKVSCAAQNLTSSSRGSARNKAATVQVKEAESMEEVAGPVPGNEFVIAQQQPNTKGSSQFVRSLAEMYPRLPCRVCRGSGQVPCERCEGRGSLARGGYQKRNPVSLDRIVGSKWTAMERTFGWRHFRIHSKRKGSGREWFLEMVATCDETSRFWVNAQNLKDRERWSMGWLQKVEIEAAQGRGDGGRLQCKACKGACVVRCAACSKRTDGSDGEEADSLEIIEV